MWQELHDYWLPLMLFAAALIVAAVLLLLVAFMPVLSEYLPYTNAVLDLFAADTTVRRCSIAGAIGLVVTALVFFRPDRSVLARKAPSKKGPGDTIAGA